MGYSEIKEKSIYVFLQNLIADEEVDYSLRKATRRIKRPSVHTPPIRETDGTWVNDNNQKVEVFTKRYLDETFKPNQIKQMSHWKLQKIIGQHISFSYLKRGGR